MSNLKSAFTKEQAIERAFEIYLNSADITNDFKPLSEVKIAEQLNKEGYAASASGVNRWKNAGEWKKALENKITAAMSSNKSLNALVKESSLESVVKNTRVDIERNNILLAGSYEIAEKEMARLLQIIHEQGHLTNKGDIEMFKFLMLTASNRSDKMLDRLALIPREALSPDEVLKRWQATEIIIEAQEEE